MLPRLKLVHQGLLVIALPLLFQILSIVTLLELTNRAQQEIAAEARSREIISTVDFLRREAAVAANLAVFYRIDPRPEILLRHDQAIDNSISSFKRLKKLLHGKYARQVKSMQRLLANGIQLDGVYMRSIIENLPVDELLNNSFKSTGSTFGQRAGPFDQVLIQETQNIANAQTERLRVRQLIFVALSVGLFFNVVFSLAVDVLLWRSLSARLRNVMDNALRLVSGTTLLPPIKSGDEVGELDGTLYQTSEELKELEEFRQQLVSMVSHELKTPLAAVQLVLETMDLGVLAPLSQAQAKTVAQGLLEVDFLIALINNLLIVENLESGNFKPDFVELPVAEILEKAAMDFEVQSNKSVRHTQASENDLVLADKHHLSIAIGNLLCRMSAAASDGSELTIDARQIDGQLTVTLAIDPPQDLALKNASDAALRWSCAEAIFKLHHAGVSLLDESTVQIRFVRTREQIADSDSMRSILKRTGLSLAHQRSHSLWRVGCILIAVPLLFSIGFTIAFANVLLEAEEQLLQSFRSKEIIAHASALSTAIGRTVSASLRGETKREGQQAKLQSPVQETHAEVMALKRLLAEDPDSLALIESLDKTAARMQPLVGEMSMRSKSSMLGDWIDSKYDVKVLSQEILNIIEPIDQIIARQMQQAQAPSLADEPANQITFWLVGGCVASLLLSLCLSLFLSMALTSKMKKLITNARLLGSRQALLFSIPGDDEIAQLDQVLHLAAKAREEFGKFKAELVVLVRGQLWPPLQRLHQALEGVIADSDATEFPEKAYRQVQFSLGNTDRIMGLVGELLDVQVMESGKFNLKFTIVSADELISEAVRSVEALSRNRNINLDPSSSSATLECDSSRVIQILVNLLSNAIKCSADGQVVRIEAEEQDQHIEFRVIDHGRGMPAAFMNKLFQLNSQAETDDKVKRGGSGLGLYISRRIVEQHGGKIAATSIQNQGSTFCFSLPLRQEQFGKDLHVAPQQLA